MPTDTTSVLSSDLCAVPESRLLPGTSELIAQLQQQIANGNLLDNPGLTKAADSALNGTRAQGTYSSRYAYDTMQIAVNRYLVEKHAQALMRMDVARALNSVLRPLLKRLPTQTDRTLEQSEFQQFSTLPTLSYLAARLLNPTNRYCP